MWLPTFSLFLAALDLVQASLTAIEEQFAQQPKAQTARDNLRFITRIPHVASFPGDWVMANFVSNEFKSAGLSHVETFELEVLLNYPVERPRVAILEDDNDSNVLFEASLSEDVLDFDDTSDTFWRNHTFHGYSPSGTVKAQAVYANYGRPVDFDRLDQAGVSVEGKLVIVRYGMCFRGLKVRNAQERGAVGVLIYSDPQDDVHEGGVYPNGPWRSPSSVQRGSVQFNSLCAGDPQRADSRYSDNALQELCGVSNYTDLIPTIPSLPIGYGDAKELLYELGGIDAKSVGDDFVGDLDIAYTVGPSQFTYLLSVHHKEEVRTIPNVVGVINGSLPKELDMPILLGNHRDAWVYGSADPNSGTAALLEVARGLGHLLQRGWKPKRSIYLLSWSGEEYGLLGSTGWAELNSELLERAAVYLNVDTVVSGDTLSVAATPSLSTVWKRVLGDLHDSPYSHAFANEPLGEIVDANTNWVMNDPQIKILGSGSDYTAFLDHFGIASLDFSFGKSSGHYGVYHSVYDSFAWMDAFGGLDGQKGSSFELIAFASKIWGVLALRLADSVVLPFDHFVQAEALQHYCEAIASQEKGLDLSLLLDAITQFEAAAVTIESSCFVAPDLTPALCNEKLGLTERQFLSKEGLPGRRWFKHLLQAPGLNLGYAAEAFPGIQQSIDAGDLYQAQEQVAQAAECIHAAANFLRVDDELLSGLWE